ncbi:hypothetical protein SUTMEG_16660 [Sutterella megalosphaeroides]|uniref:Uncharacterized protein n=1 Tax=Sutterella megalosphaeroides TaxID=2494234 RepID=A0A2Z6IB54_9BURK|nr:hypothetical protein SUTMEG_16660 [Sutterella megalosphaeroides]
MGRAENGQGGSGGKSDGGELESADHGSFILEKKVREGGVKQFAFDVLSVRSVPRSDGCSGETFGRSNRASVHGFQD